ncbi:MAG: UPF0755 protein [Parcubacteria group bacterium Gr01-1014_33]|nr:MAG: UPF0755 protein [Parcubacteria group bacterium Gr01-1014_33]
MSPQEQLIQSLISKGYLKTPRIRDAFRAIDRADFVLPEHKNAAYGNYPLPIGNGQTISQPLTVAFMLEVLGPQPGEKILDIGSGSGWTTALLAHIVSQKSESGVKSRESGEGRDGKIFAIERIPELYRFGNVNIEKSGFTAHGIVKTFCKDGTQGLPQYAPFDKILASATASEDIPLAWKDQLKIGGRIVAPIGNSLLLFIKKSADDWEKKEFPGFAFVPLIRNQRLEVGDQKEKNQKGEKKWRTNFKKGVGIFFLIFLAGATTFTNETYRPHTNFKGAKQVEIMPGLGSRKIGALLKKEGIIRSKWIFVAYVSLDNKASYLQPGTYVFTDTIAIPEIARLLAGNAKKEITITIIEGWNADDIESYLASQNIIHDESFQAFTQPEPSHTFAARFEFLKDKPKTAGLEGYLFPDTYRVFSGSSAKEIIEKMLGNFDKKLIPELRNEISRKGKTIFEIVTMASLIEKEVVSDEDRAVVSGILWKRLQLGIPLQVDATINYIRNQELGIRNYENNRKISIADTKIDSPYNTYLYRGLPAGPISNPGISAIRAAMYPKESPYLYYLSTPEGKTIFSRTLEDHNIAKAKYLTK